MTTNEARDAAWRKWAGLDHAHAVARTAFTAGWDARGEYDKEQIAALVKALDEAYRVLLIHYRMPHEPTNGDLSSMEDVERFDEWMEGAYRPNRPMLTRVIDLAMEHERRALAGQSEEATG